MYGFYYGVGQPMHAGLKLGTNTPGLKLGTNTPYVARMPQRPQFILGSSHGFGSPVLDARTVGPAGMLLAGSLLVGAFLLWDGKLKL